MSTSSFRRGDAIQHRDGSRGIVNVGTDDIGLTVVSWSDGGTDTVVAVDLTLATPRVRRGDVVRAPEDGDRGIVVKVIGDDIADVEWWTSGIRGSAYFTDLELVRPRRYSPAIAAMMDGWDGGDVWGSAMAMAWAIAEVSRAVALERDVDPMHDVRSVPTILDVSWGMTPALSIDEMADVEDDPESRGDVSFESGMLAAAYRDGIVTDADLVFAARVLDRYLDLCRAAGLDY